MRLLLILFGYLFFSASLVLGQDLAIDLSVNRLSSRQLVPLAEINQPANHLFLLETESKFQTAESEHTFSDKSDHLSSATALRYRKIRRIVYEAPLVRPHFLTRSELPRCGSVAKIADNDHSIPKKLSSSWQLVY